MQGIRILAPKQCRKISKESLRGRFIIFGVHRYWSIDNSGGYPAVYSHDNLHDAIAWHIGRNER